jgi:hypothetical protein
MKKEKKCVLNKSYGKGYSVRTTAMNDSEDSQAPWELFNSRSDTCIHT